MFQRLLGLDLALDSTRNNVVIKARTIIQKKSNNPMDFQSKCKKARRYKIKMPINI